MIGRVYARPQCWPVRLEDQSGVTYTAAMKDLSQLMAIAAMMGGAPGLKRRKAKEPRLPKKYRKESEAERRARQAKK